VLAVCGRNSSDGFLVFALVIAVRIIISPFRASVGSPRTKNPPDGMVTIPGFLIRMDLYCVSIIF
jgi:hypothetical protein